MSGTVPYDPFGSNSPVGGVVYPYESKMQFGSALSPQYIVGSTGSNVQMGGVSLTDLMSTSRTPSPQLLPLASPVVLPQAPPVIFGQSPPKVLPSFQQTFSSQAVQAPLQSSPRGSPLRFTPAPVKAPTGSTDPWDVFAFGSPASVKSPIAAPIVLASSTPSYISPSFFQSPSIGRPPVPSPGKSAPPSIFSPVPVSGGYGQVKTIPQPGSGGALYSSSPQPFTGGMRSVSLSTPPPSQGSVIYRPTGTTSQSLQSFISSSQGTASAMSGISPTGSVSSAYSSAPPLTEYRGIGAITLSDFKATFDELDDFYGVVANSIDRDDAVREQEGMEKSLLQDSTPCALASEGGLHGKGPYLKTEEIKKLARNRFYDVNAMKAIACSLDSITYIPEAGGLTASERIRHWFRGVRQLGEDTVEGYAMEGTYGNASDLFILKAPRRGKDLIHEIIVGMYCTNKMRAFNPNFSYVYGYMKCSPPVIDAKTTEVISYCYGKNDVEYVIYENVTDSISMREFVETCTGKEWLEVYLQVILSLLDAHARFRFTHYDLHAGNVLIQKKVRFDKNETRSGGVVPFQIKYPYYGRDIYLRTSNLARIIDYGFGYFEYMSKSYGKGGYERYSIFRDKPFPMADAYKLLAGSAVQAGPEAKKVIAQVFTFFNSKQDMDTALKGQSDYYYCLPYIKDQTALWTFGDLLDHIETECKDYRSIISKTRSKDPLLGCEAECFNLSKTVEQIGGYSEELPYDIFTYYDVLDRSEGAERKGIILDYKGKYPKAEKDFISKYVEPLVKKIEGEIKGISMIDFSAYTYDEVINGKTLDLYIRLLTRFINIEDNVKTLEWYVKIGDEAYDSQNPSRSKSPYNKYIPLLVKYNKMISEATGILNDNDKIIDRYIRDRRFRSSISSDRNLEWYRSKRNFYRINPR